MAALLVPAGAASSAAEPHRDPPAHPTTIYAEYQGERYPVIAAKKDQPVIMVGGERRILPATTQLSTERSDTFLGPAARLEPKAAGEIGARPWGMSWNPEFKITSTHDLSDCFVALIQFDEEFFLNPEELKKSRARRADLRPDRTVESPRLRLQELPELKAGIPGFFSVNASVRNDSYWTNLPSAVETKIQIYFFVLVFAGGIEVESNLPPHANRYFHHREKLMHQSLLRRWLEQNRGATQPLKPVLQIPPRPPRNDGPAGETLATFVVSADGTVQDLALAPGLAPDADKAVRDALSAWLFLPKLDRGKPVATTVRLPLKF